MYTSRSLFLVCVLCGLTLVLTACGPQQAAESVPGVTDSTITLGTWTPLTGPAAPWGATGRGIDTYFKMINEEGGIHGRTINFLLRDDQYQPARTVAAVKEMAERDNVFGFVGGTGTATGRAVQNYIIQNQIPWVGVLSGAHFWTYPEQNNVFGGLPLYFDEAALLVNYAVEELGLTNIAMLYQNDDYGKSGLVGAQMALEKHGLEMAEALSVEVMDSDLSSQAIRLRESGAEVVMLYVTPRHAAIILGEGAKLGFQPQWMGSLTLADVGLMHTLTQGLWEGMIYATSLMPSSADHPEMNKYRDAKHHYAPEEMTGFLFYGGMTIADNFAEALRRAGPNLTRASFIEAMSSLEGYANIGAPISYANNTRHGTQAVQLHKCISATEVEQLTDWITADLDIEQAIHTLEGGN